MLDQFWNEINAQLHQIRMTEPDTYEGVRAILMGDYPEVKAYVGRNGNIIDAPAFFAGGGGDATLMGALIFAGWRLTDAEADYYYSVAHKETGETLTYVEGDVYPGNQFKENA